MKFIIFIGQHKVGSTALQAFLARNSVALLRAGILYPSVDFQGCAVNMSKLLQGGDSAEPLPINAREPHNALAFRMIADATENSMPIWHKGMPATPQMLKAIRMQIQYMNPKVVILAAEVFSNLAATAPLAIKKLANLCEGHEVRIVATLRRVDEYLASWHGQRLKFGHKLEPLRHNASHQYINSIHFNYKLMLDKWFEEFPDADFVLRNYHDVLKSGGACEDFVEHCGVPFPSNLHRITSRNPSFHRALYEVARLGNKELHSDQAAQLKEFLLRIQDKLDLPESKSIEMFGETNRKLMRQEFSPIHQYLCDINGVDSFFPDIDEILQTREINEVNAANHALSQIKTQINSWSKGSLSSQINETCENFLMNLKI